MAQVEAKEKARRAEKAVFRAKSVIRYASFTGTERAFREFVASRGIGNSAEYHKVYTPYDVRRVRCALNDIDPEGRSEDAPPLIVTRVNKGGVGKTTITANLAVALANQGYRVLLIDGDPQASCTAMFNVDWAYNEVKHVGHLMLDECTLDEAVIPLYDHHMLDFVAASPDLDIYQRQIDLRPNNRDKTFEQWLQANKAQLSRYDVILVDTNPASTTLNSVLSVPCRLWLVVMRLDPTSVASMTVFERLRAQFNVDYRGERRADMIIVANGLHEGKPPTKAALQALAAKFGDHMADDIIPDSVGFMRQIDLFDGEASGPLMEKDHTSVAATSVIDLSRTLIKRYDIKLAGHALGRAAVAVKGAK